ncbi:MAG TPA: ABC transporter ATP-binding protein [Armatimonadota bacterium]
MSAPDQSPDAAILAKGLRKTFGRTVAVEGLDLTIPTGEIFGLVGPDGAGKTTTFRMLLGLVAPDAGEARLGRFDVRKHPRQAREVAGYVAQQFTLYGELTVEENLRFVAEVRSLSAADTQAREKELLELTGLAPFTARLAQDLSGGMRRKLAFLCALLHHPRILLLDEPTTGVDPVSRREFWRMLYGLPAQGVTLLVSTPYLDEAERCHRLGLMVGGKLLAVDTPANLVARMPDALARIRTDARKQASQVLARHPEVRWVDTVGSSLRVAYDRSLDSGDGGRIGRWLKEAGVPYQSCEAATPALADLFNSLTGQPQPRLESQEPAAA